MSKVRTGSVIAFLAAAVSLVAAVSAFGGSNARAATTVNVTAGKPSGVAVHPLEEDVVKGVTTFKVTNKGTIEHDFKIAGKKTRVIKPGKTETLKVTFTKPGKFPFLCTVPGHMPPPAMKGTLTVKK